MRPTPACFLSCLLVSGSVASADEYFWIQSGGGDFADQDNWSPLGPPSVADVAVFDLPDVYTVTFGQNHTNQRLQVDDGQVSFNLGGWEYAVEDDGGSGPSVLIGWQAGLDPTLTLSGGSLLANACALGEESGGSGSLIIDGSDTVWTNRDDFSIGGTGAGYAVFTNGASVYSYADVYIGAQTDGTNSGYGNVTLSGQDGQITTWTIGDESVYYSALYVGDAGEGTININAYSTITMKEHQVNDQGDRSSGWVILGSQAGSVGHVNVSGEQAELNIEHSPMIVGDWGNGDLHVTNGGRLWVGDGELWLASQSGVTGAVEVTGAGSTLEEHSSYASVVGVGGTGTLHVNDFGSASFSHLIVGEYDQSKGYVYLATNGTLSSGYSCLGDQSGSYGEVNIDQESVWTVTDRMNIGRQGTAEMWIWGGGRLDQTFDSTFALVLGSDAGSNGTVTIEDGGSRIDTAGELAIGMFGAGTMNVNSGATVTAKQALLASFAGSEGWLNVQGDNATFHTTTSGLLVGREGEGHLLVQQGGNVTLAQRLDVGEQPGGKGWASVQSNGHVECDGARLGRWGAKDSLPDAEGYLTIWGPGAFMLSTAQIVVGYGGYGELALGDTAGLITQKGTSETGTSGAIGVSAGSTGLATVNNASWEQDGALVVGWSGTGTLNVEDWGTVKCQSAEIGRMSDGIGNVTVEGDHAVWNVAGDLSVGGTMTEAGGTGNLYINGSEGHVRVGHADGGTLRVWENGLVRLDGGRMVVGSDVLDEPDALWVAPKGIVDLRGGIVDATKVYVDGLLSGFGEISGDVYVSADSGSGPGVLSPGNSAGTITITGDLTLAGLARFDIMGIAEGEYDLVQQSTAPASFAVDFGGTLELRFSGDYGYGDEWQIFDFDQYTGDFTSLAWTGLPSGLEADFDATTGIVRLLPEPTTVCFLSLGGLVLISRRRWHHSM